MYSTMPGSVLHQTGEILGTHEEYGLNTAEEFLDVHPKSLEIDTFDIG